LGSGIAGRISQTEGAHQSANEKKRLPVAMLSLGRSLIFHGLRGFCDAAGKKNEFFFKNSLTPFRL
jgi:hypothetical protein